MKRHRPWDKQPQLQPKNQQHSTVVPSTSTDTSTKDESLVSCVPFVKINNKKYYSDRYYINATVYNKIDENINDTNHNETNPAPSKLPNSNNNNIFQSSSTTATATSETVLFDRSEFISSYFHRQDDDHPQRNMRAIIFGTYTVDDMTLQTEFPNIFKTHNCSSIKMNDTNYNDSTVHECRYFNDKKDTNNIPCLVLYGKRNSTIEMTTTSTTSPFRNSPTKNVDTNIIGKRLERNYNDSSSVDEEIEDVEIDDTSIVSSSSVETAPATQNEFITNTIANSPITTQSNSSIKYESLESSLTATTCSFPPTVHFSQITPSWFKDTTSSLFSSSFKSLIDPNTGYLYDHIVDKYRTNITHGGVHHSKYIIVFETDGSIVICISTANLTPSTTIDATWIQRFPPQSKTEPLSHEISIHEKQISTNDFGRTLANYMQCTMLSTAKDNVTVQWFVQQYLQWSSIRNFERNYDYSNVQVQLVTVIPGEYKCNNQRPMNGTERSKENNTTVKNGATQFFYGQERISYLVQQLELSMKIKFRNMLYTKFDQLILQPTSFGGGWNISNMTQVVRSYMNMNHGQYRNDQEMIQRVDIIWPTMKFVQAINKQLRTCWKRQMQVKQQSSNTSIADDDINGGYLFLSSEAFNKIDLQCLNRMVVYQPRIPHIPLQKLHIPLVPHFKSATRLIGCRKIINSNYPKLIDYEDCLSWFLLTSACLSRGAQGEYKVIKNDNDLAGREISTIAYTNFEMGVLFGSYLSGNSAMTTNDRIYVSNPTNKHHTPCPSIKSPRLIPLPIPYRFHSSRYIQDEDLAIFDETPYFHEIVPGTGCEGNMLLTPYGSTLAKAI